MRMKLLTACLMVFCSLFQSCTRSADDLTTPQAQVQAVSAGTWKITLFTDSGADETHKFSGYGFQFGSGGTVTATSGTTANTGTWKIESSKFVIDMGAKTDSNKPLGELTDDWKIVSVSATEIKLADDNVSSGEFLTFVRN